MVVYYDTVADPGRLKTDVWMQSSTDGGQSWSDAQKVTTQQTDEATANNDNGNQYGDYIGLTGYAGQFFACWTDRRSGGFEEIWGAPLPLVRRAVTFEIDRDHFGQDEVDAARSQPGGAVFTTAFRIAVDGFTARELGVTGAGSTGTAPGVTFAPATGISASCTSVDSTDPAFARHLAAHPFRLRHRLRRWRLGLRASPATPSRSRSRRASRACRRRGRSR